MLDVPVPQIVLQGPRIDSRVGQIKSTRMPQHVGVNRERQARGTPRFGDDPMDRPCGEGAATFRDKQVDHPGDPRLELAEGAQFHPASGMESRHPVFDALDMEQRRFQVYHIPAQAHECCDPQAMPIHQQDHGGIPVPIAALSAGCSEEMLHFVGR
jgi:hypothetical protein